jgi:hypothetical protein
VTACVPLTGVTESVTVTAGPTGRAVLADSDPTGPGIYHVTEHQ